MERSAVHREPTDMSAASRSSAVTVSDLRQADAILEAVNHFNEAFERHDVEAVMAAMTSDCVFESTAPPDGQRHVGTDEVRAVWEEFFRSSPGASFSRRPGGGPWS